MAGAPYDWVYWVLGGALAAAGVCLAAWGLFRDRAKRKGVLRRRCPKCWYDMAGAPGLTCPECGQASRTEKQLHRTRRRWGMAVAGIALALLGAAGSEFPAWRSGGWIGVLPTSILILVAPPEQQSQPAQPWFVGLAAPPVAVTGNVIISGNVGNTGGAGDAMRAIMLNQVAGARQRVGVPLAAGAVPLVQAPVVQAPIDTRLCDAAWDRLLSGRMWRWQSELFLRRVARHNGVDHPWFVTHLEFWPADMPLRLLIEPAPGFAALGAACSNEFWLDGGSATSGGPVLTRGEDIELMSPSAGQPVTLHYRMRAGGATVYRGRMQLPIQIKRDRASLMAGCSDTALTDVVRAALNPELTEDEGHVRVMVSDRSREALWSRLEVVVGYEIEVRLDGTVLGRANGRVEAWRPVWKNWEALPIAWEPGGLARLKAAPDRAEIRVIGRAEGAAAVYLAHAPRHMLPDNRCWTGEFTVPARWGPPSRPAPAEDDAARSGGDG